MSGQTVILSSKARRELASRMVWQAPEGAVLNVRDADRTADQNAKLWAMLSDISRAKPDGRRHTPDVWKALFMHACGHAVQFEAGLDGSPFPIGFRSSRLSKWQMSELIEFIHAWAAERGVRFSDGVAQ